MVVAFILLVGLGLVMSLPIFSRISIGDPLVNDISEVRTLVLALRTFAHDNGDQFPQTLNELLPDYIDDSRLFTTSYTGSGKSHSYIYLNGVSGIAAPRTPLVISPPLPSPQEGLRVVGFVGGNAALVKMTTAQVEAAKKGQWPSP